MTNNKNKLLLEKGAVVNINTITSFLKDPVKCAKALGTAITVLTVLQTLNNIRVQLQSSQD